MNIFLDTQLDNWTAGQLDTFARKHPAPGGGHPDKATSWRRTTTSRGRKTTWWTTTSKRTNTWRRTSTWKSRGGPSGGGRPPERPWSRTNWRITWRKTTWSKDNLDWRRTTRKRMTNRRRVTFSPKKHGLC